MWKLLTVRYFVISIILPVSYTHLDVYKRQVHIGSSVTLFFNDTKEEVTYDIVGSTESDPLNGRLSNETPLAQAILDHKVGDVCEVRVANPYTVEIVKIK